MARWNHKISLPSGTKLPQTPRFNKVWKRYQCNASLIEYVGGPGSFRNTTVGGPITGMEQHLGVLDDFVKGRAEANSKLHRDRTWNWFTDDFSSRFNKDSAMLVICTRWHVDDLLGRLMQKYPGMRVVSFPAIAEKDEPFRRKGEALFPSLKPLDMLLDQKRLMSEASWHAEYQQRPYVVGGGIIPIDKLQIIPVFDHREISSTVLAVDKAATHGGDGAYTAIVIMHKMKNGTFVIDRVVRGRWGVLEREQNIKYWADATKQSLNGSWKFTVVIEVEPGVAARNRRKQRSVTSPVTCASVTSPAPDARRSCAPNRLRRRCRVVMCIYMLVRGSRISLMRLRAFQIRPIWIKSTPPRWHFIIWL